MSEVVFLLEEPSAQDLLEGLIPRIVPSEWSARYIPFQGKQDLEKRMGRILRAWQNPNARFVVLRDQDSGDCRAIKEDLLRRCRDAGRGNALVRIACRELESWIAGDLESFATEFACASARRQQGKAKFRDPDTLMSPVAELRRFAPTYQKRDGARRMGPRLSVDRNASRSFQIFCAGISRMIQGSYHFSTDSGA